jgi:pimeloyl-ACP methyl ester carboxylesterase
MLAFERRGSGPTLLLLHGTTSSREVWQPMLERLTRIAEVIAVDLPGHGESPPSTHTPPAWAREVAALLDAQGVERPAVAGHSAGGWTALELAKLGRARAVLALAPAGLWRKRSPRLTNLALSVNWHAGRAAPKLATHAVRSPLVRAVALRTVSADPRAVAPDIAATAARTVAQTDGFAQHFSQTRRARFVGGREIDVPVTVVWGERDRIAPAGKSRRLDELPPQTVVDTWPACGHMLMWDAPQRLEAAIVELVASSSSG